MPPLYDRTTPEHIEATDFIAARIAEWPTLFQTRMDALERIFTSGDYTFDTGAPRHSYASETHTRDESYDTPLDEPAARTDEHAPFSHLMAVRKRRAEALFVRENAAEIARCEYGEHYDLRSVPSFSTSRLNAIALDKLNPCWRAALIEYCKGVVCFDEKRLCARRRAQGVTEEAIKRDLTPVQGAKAAAEECLARLGLGAAEADEARRLRLGKLRQEAEAFGFKLTPVDAA